MKKLFALSGFVLFFSTGFAQIYDTTTLRSYINTNIIPNSTRSITATQMNYIFNGNLNVLPTLLKKYYDSVWIASGNLYVKKNGTTISYAIPVNTHTHPQSDITGLVDSVSTFRSLINSLISDSAYQATQIADRVKYSDTASVLSNRLKISDTAQILSTRMKYSDTATLSNRIDLKADKSTTINGHSLATGSVTVSASDLTTGTLPDAQLSTNVTVQGNTFNGNNQLLQLDAGGKVPFANLPSGLYTVKGTWSAATNTPTLADGSGTAGWVYQSNSAGDVDFGSGSIHFEAGDYVGYNGSIWQWSPGTSAVRSVSVNGSTSQQGVVSITLPNSSVTNAMLANSTISGISLGSNLSTLTFGAHLSASSSSYNGSAAATITSDATSSNVASAIVARNSSGDFAAGVITATSFSGAGTGLTGTASSLSIGGTAASETLATVTGRGATTSTAVTINNSLTIGSANLNLSNAYYLTGRNLANTSNIALIGRNTSDNVSIDPNGYGTVLGGNLTVSGAISGTAGTFNTQIQTPAIYSTSTNNLNLGVNSTTYLSIVNDASGIISVLDFKVGGQKAVWWRDEDGFSSSSARRAWAATANYDALGTWSLKVGDSAGANPLTSGTTALSVSSNLAAAFSSSVTASSHITSGGTSSQVVSGTGSLVTLYKGTYTPTISSLTNLSSGNSYSTKYTVIDSVVTVSFQAGVNVTSTGLTSFEFSIPVSSSFTGSGDLSGAAAIGTGGGSPNSTAGLVYAFASNGTGTVVWTATATGTQTVTVTCQYIIK